MKKEPVRIQNQTVEECLEESLMKMAAAAIVEKDLKEAEEAAADSGIPEPNPEWLKNLAEDFSRKYAKLERKHAARKHLKKVGAFAAAFVLVAAGCFSASFFTVDAFRNRVINLYSDVHEEFTKLNISVNKEIDLSSWDPDYLPGYVPEGFYPQKVQKAKSGVDTSYIVFKNDSTEEIFTLTIDRSHQISMTIDSEEMIKQELQIMGNEAFLAYKTDYSSSSLYFSDNKATVTISGTIHPDEIVMIAQSLSKV